MLIHGDTFPKVTYFQDGVIFHISKKDSPKTVLSKDDEAEVP